MNIELLKRLAELRDQFNELKSEFKKEGGYGLHIDGEVQVNASHLLGKENLEIRSRNTNEYPYKIFTVVEGIKIFAIATTEDIAKFPQFKEHQKAILLQQLADLENKGEVTA